MKELISTLFKGPMLIKTMSGNLPGGVIPASQYNSSGFATSVPVNTTETTQG
jgi:hypothetical protein